MTASTSMSVFHQWLLADPSSKTSACAIVLHIADSRPADLLIQEITEYLNEYDDDGEGRWLPATQELVEKVATDPSHRRLLGLADSFPADPKDSTPGQQKTLLALGRRGHVVFRAASNTYEALGTGNHFHAGVGTTGEITNECHIVLNPDLISQSCIAHIIGDVFLEWLHCETRRNAPIQDIR